MNIGIIIGSVREPRRGEAIAKWVLNQTTDRTHHYTLIDLKEYNLPHYNEPGSPRTSGGYMYDTTKRWSETIQQLDGFVFVSPEYNGFFPGSVKDAIDFLYHEWVGKPFAIVGYGGRGAKWASQHLSTLLKRFEMRDAGWVGVHKPGQSLQPDGSIDPQFIEGSITDLLHELEIN